MDGTKSTTAWSMIEATLPEAGSYLRDELLLAEVRQGNFQHRWAPITASSARDTIDLEVSEDALRVGASHDCVRITVSASTAQRIADDFGAMLLTPRIADLIRQQADFAMAPNTLSSLRYEGVLASTTCMVAHSHHVDRRLGWRGRRGLAANTGKDWVLTNRLALYPDRAATYGWHMGGTGIPATLAGFSVLQPLSLAHDRHYTDYGQTVRMVKQRCRVNGVDRALADVLRDPRLAPLVSHEGVLEVLRQPGVPYYGPLVASPPPREDAVLTVPRVLRRGVAGADVKRWQYTLGVTTVDGAFGPVTESATRAWQRAHALEPDGVVGPLTRAAAAAMPIFIPAKNLHRYGMLKPDTIVLHTTEDFEGTPSAIRVAELFSTPGATKHNVHFCVDADTVVQCVQETAMANHAPGINHRSLGIEHTGYLRHTQEDWADPEAQTMLRRSAELVATLCRRHRIPARYVDVGGLKDRLPGITTQSAVALAYNEAPHNEIGEGFPVEQFLEMVNEYTI